MAKQLLPIAVKIICLIFVLYFLMIRLSLGWFICIIWIIGLLLSLWITKKEGSVLPNALIIVSFIYLLLNVIVWNIFIDRKHHRSFFMEWVDRGKQNQFQESESVLRFVNSPNIMSEYIPMNFPII